MIDPQQKRVYLVEDIMAVEFEIPIFTMKECRAFGREVAAYVEDIHPKLRYFDIKRQTSEDYPDESWGGRVYLDDGTFYGDIRLIESHYSPLVILHEASHILHGEKGAAHGVAFMRIYMKLLEKFVTKEIVTRFKELCDEYDVRYK